MNKKILLLGILTGLVFLTVACTKATEDQTGQDDGGETTQVIFEKLETVPTELKSSIVDVQKMKGYGVIKSDGEEKNIFIGLGEKPTDGYSVDVKSVLESDDKVVIEIDEIKPAADAKVTTGKTYPYIILKVSTTMDTFEVIDTKGEKFKDVIDETSGTTEDTTEETNEKTTEKTTEDKAKTE
ncbi:MAG TPA: hypothetical protein DEP72_07290 [Clostridiales bacterium]|nr:MAG: hypothetical protein A2Y18_06405 [Clostridiales bacterium GWD2_32_19]HCC07939.1 hypothetical protein [Clostridiales bacterium]